MDADHVDSPSCVWQVEGLHHRRHHPLSSVLGKHSQQAHAHYARLQVEHVVPRLTCQHEGAARAPSWGTYQLRDNTFECSMSNRASSVLSYDQLQAFETSKLTHTSHHCVR